VIYSIKRFLSIYRSLTHIATILNKVLNNLKPNGNWLYNKNPSNLSNKQHSDIWHNWAQCNCPIVISTAQIIQLILNHWNGYAQTKAVRHKSMRIDHIKQKLQVHYKSRMWDIQGPSANGGLRTVHQRGLCQQTSIWRPSSTKFTTVVMPLTAYGWISTNDPMPGVHFLRGTSRRQRLTEMKQWQNNTNVSKGTAV